MLVAEAPDRFWRPAYVGVHGWIGIRLDLKQEPDWNQLEAFVDHAWSMVAPRRLLRTGRTG